MRRGTGLRRRSTRPAGFRLGTGDLLFYGVVVGRGAVRGLACAAGAGLGVVVGVCLTVGWTVVSARPAVPALPLALALGSACYFAVPPLLPAFVDAIAGEAVYL